MHPLNSALPGPYLLVQVNGSALVAHLYTYVAVLAVQQDFLSLWNDLADPIFDGVGLAGFKSSANVFLLA